MGGVYIDISNATNLFSVGNEIKMNLEHPQTFQHLNIDGTIVRIEKSGIGVKFKKEI